LPANRFGRITNSAGESLAASSGRLDEADMRRLLVLACTAILLAGCAPEDLLTLLPTVQSGSLGRDVFLFEDNIVSDDVVEGDLFAWGTTVVINGQVDGSIYVYGRQVTLNAPVRGSVTVVGREVVLTDQAQIGQGVLFAGVVLQMEEGSTVGGGVTAAGYQVLLDGAIGEFVRGAILRLRLDGTVGSAPAGALPARPGLAFQPHAPLLVGWRLSSPAQALSADDAIQVDLDDLQARLLAFARELITLFVFGLLAVAFRPTLLYVLADRVRASAWSSLGYGIFALIVGYFGSALAAVVLGFLSYWLFTLSLDVLAVTLVGVGGGLLALWLILLTLFAAYGAKLVLSAWIGRAILRRASPRAAENRFWPLVLGGVIYLLVVQIPYVGLVVAMAASLLGLGAAWLVWRDMRTGGA
jgi:hypothetical protein